MLLAILEKCRLPDAELRGYGCRIVSREPQKEHWEEKLGGPSGARPGQRKQFAGLELSMRAFPGAIAVRVVHSCRQGIEAHAHDLACITLPAIGDGTELFDGGEARMDGPSAVFHSAGMYHADRIAAGGLETISIQFDPVWLRLHGLSHRAQGSFSRRGGAGGAAARRLSAAWTNRTFSEARLAEETARFLEVCVRPDPVPDPKWLSHVLAWLDTDDPPDTGSIAARLAVHPAWLARAYRGAVGEGLHESIRRKRTAKAVALLRATAMPLAAVAAEAGFSDQSYMNRTFRALLGRTPLQVRRELSVLPLAST